ncbi:MAG: hypothetical protein ACK56I_07740, partial [bacterium]
MWATKPHLAVQDARSHFAHANKLRRTARQHNTRATFLAKPTLIQLVLQQLESFFKAWLDDANHHGARNARDMMFIFAQQRHRQIFAFII